MIMLQVFYLIILGIVLAVSSDWMVKATSFIAKEIQIKSFVIGFLLLGAITTIPEMFVAYQSVRDGVPQLSVGNLLGGAILLLSFVMGMSAIFLKKIVLDHGMTTKDIAFSSFVIAAPALVLWDGKLTRFEGIILVCIYLFHVIFLSKEQHVVGRIEHHAKHVAHMGHAILLFVLGLVGIGVSSHFMVTIGEMLAKNFGISPFVIGLFLITFGTNLPELMLAFTAVFQKKRDLAFGDILGSAVINTPILGIICIISPFSVSDHMRMRVTLALVLAVSFFFFLAAFSKRDITRKEGLWLLAIYVIFVAFELTNI